MGTAVPTLRDNVPEKCGTGKNDEALVAIIPHGTILVYLGDKGTHSLGHVGNENNVLLFWSMSGLFWCLFEVFWALYEP